MGNGEWESVGLSETGPLSVCFGAAVHALHVKILASQMWHQNHRFRFTEGLPTHDSRFPTPHSRPQANCLRNLRSFSKNARKSFTP
jgi:hypothetical protein